MVGGPIQGAFNWERRCLFEWSLIVERDLRWLISYMITDWKPGNENFYIGR